MTTTIQVPVKLRDQLARLVRAEARRTGGSVSYAQIIQKLIDEREQES